MSLNIVSYNFNGRLNNYKQRKPLLNKLIDETEFDILCSQEFSKVMFRSRDKAFPKLKKYNAVQSFNIPIFVSSDIDIIEKHENLVLAPKSDTYTRKFGYRMSIALLNKNGKDFVISNCHLDFKKFNISEDIRSSEIQGVLDFIDEHYPQVETRILCGDLNAFPETKTIKLLNEYQDSYDYSVNNLCETFNGYETKSEPDRLDYIFVKGAKINSHEIINKKYDGKYPSDHNIITSNISFF